MPEIWYYNPKDNRKHRYIPDIWIPKDNLIIEVKSIYTYNKYIEKNNLKKDAVLSNGFNYQIKVYNR